MSAPRRECPGEPPATSSGSKAELYRAVLERAFAQVRDAVRSGRERALPAAGAAGVVLAGAVGDYFDFIAARPNFVRLIEWEALRGRPARRASLRT